jgi:hypothetical protein
MKVLITLVLPVGGDAGPFNLYSDTDGYVTPFATNISASALIAGYTVTNVPDGTTIIKVQSVGVCTNFVNVQVNVLPTTTTTSSSSTTSTSTTAGPTTTTTSSSSTSTSSTTTSTTTINCISWAYNISLYNCNDCIQTGGGSVVNSEPLTIGKWYVYGNFKMYIDSYIQCSAGAPIENILDSSQEDTCEAVTCPTTTTTTTGV